MGEYFLFGDDLFYNMGDRIEPKLLILNNLSSPCATYNDWTIELKLSDQDIKYLISQNLPNYQTPLYKSIIKTSNFKSIIKTSNFTFYGCFIGGYSDLIINIKYDNFQSVDNSSLMIRSNRDNKIRTILN